MGGFLPNLPSDLAAEILSRVPADSLVEFKRVSKPWYALITELVNDPGFVAAHFINTKKQSSASIVVREKFRAGELSLITFLNIDATDTDDCIYSIREDLNLPPSQYVVCGFHTRVVLYVFHCDGIVCVVEYPRKVYICNPVLHECRSVPELEGNDFIGLGFGYVSEAKDYKFVKIFVDNRHYRSEVYSVNNDSWKVITTPDDGISMLNLLMKKAFYCRGVLYWYGYEPLTIDHGILCFDMCVEEFYVIDIPDLITDVEGIGVTYAPRFTVWNDLLALSYQYSKVISEESGFLDIRVLDMNFRKSKVAPSWTRKLLLRSFQSPVIMLPIIQNNGYLMQDCEKQLFAYNLHTGKFRDVWVDDAYNTWEDWYCLYEKSLVSIKR